MTGKEKLKRLKGLESIEDMSWELVKCDRYKDWIRHRDPDFYRHIPIASTIRDKRTGIFIETAKGVASSRNAWAWNPDDRELAKNITRTIEYAKKQDPKNIIQSPGDIKLSVDMIERIENKKIEDFDGNAVELGMYRPFDTQFFYNSETILDRPSSTMLKFPQASKPTRPNIAICVPTKSQPGYSSPYMVACIPESHLLYHTMVLPLHIYDEDWNYRYNITDYAVKAFREHYKDDSIDAEGIFLYVYAILNHNGYKRKYEYNLAKEIPYIPFAPDFHAFKEVGEKLGALHTEAFNAYGEYPIEATNVDKIPFSTARFPEHDPDRYEYKKLAYGRKKIYREGREVTVNDPSKILIDGHEVFSNIPHINYRVAGWTPLDWAIQQYQITVDEDSGITKDNRWPDIIKRIRHLIYIGVESDRLINTLPEEFETEEAAPVNHGLDDWIQK